MKLITAVFCFAVSSVGICAVSSPQLPLERFNGIYDLLNTSGSVNAPDDLCWPRKNKRCVDPVNFKQTMISNICPATVIVSVGDVPGEASTVIGVYFGDPTKGFLPHAMFTNSNQQYAATDIKHREMSAPDWVSSYDVTGGVKNFRSLKIHRNNLQYTTLHRDVHIRDSFYTDWSLNCRYLRRPF